MCISHCDGQVLMVFQRFVKKANKHTPFIFINDYMKIRKARYVT